MRISTKSRAMLACLDMLDKIANDPEYYPPSLSTGLCFNLFHNSFPPEKRTWNPYNLVTVLSKGWPPHSGNPGYPVPIPKQKRVSPHSPFIPLYNTSHPDPELAEHARLRRDLAGYLAAQIRSRKTITLPNE